MYVDSYSGKMMPRRRTLDIQGGLNTSKLRRADSRVLSRPKKKFQKGRGGGGILKVIRTTGTSGLTLAFSFEKQTKILS